jgi:glycosyltransferase
VKRNYKLSVIVPFLEIDTAFEETVNSVLQQTEIADIELILVAKSLSVFKINYIKSLGSRINVKILENNQGIYQAINSGIEASVGQYILVLGCGDGFLNKNSSKKIFELFICNPDYIYFNVLLRDENSNPIVFTEVGIVDGVDKIKKIHHQGVVISKNCHKRFGFYDTTFRTSADLDFLIKIYSKNSVYIDEVLTFFNLGGESSPSIAKFFRQRREIVEIHRKHRISIPVSNKIIFFIKTILFSLSPIFRKNLIKLRKTIKG